VIGQDFVNQAIQFWLLFGKVLFFQQGYGEARFGEDHHTKGVL